MDIRKELRNKPQRPWTAEQEEMKARDESTTWNWYALAFIILQYMALVIKYNFCDVELYCRPSIRYVFLNKYFLIYEMSYGTS